MTDKEYIENIDKVDTDTLFENLEYYGCDSYYRDLWYATIEELKKRIEIRPRGKWIRQYRKSYKLITDEGTLIGEFTKCPKCLYDEARGSNFCPNCGADMRKGGAE